MSNAVPDATGARLTNALVDQVLSGLDDFGCDWTLTDLAGWGSPASTLSPVQKSRAPGAWPSPRQLAPRVLGPGGLINAPSKAAARDALDRLNAAVSLDASTLAVTEDDLTRTVTVYRQDEVLHTWLTDRLVQWSAQLVALDPRKYGDTITARTGLPSSFGGLTWPVTWPIEWTGQVNSGVISINNPGNTDAPISMRIDGPCQGPIIRHDTSGNELVFATTYNLGAGSFLDIDCKRRIVLEGGTASRNGWITQRGWFSLAPGDNDFIFEASAYNATAQLTITTAPAYL